MNFKQNEEAVSPVIGVILMVAITVILAAVIAAFVFGMTGNVQSTKTVSMQAALNGDNITLTISGGPGRLAGRYIVRAPPTGHSYAETAHRDARTHPGPEIPPSVPHPRALPGACIIRRRR